MYLMEATDCNSLAGISRCLVQAVARVDIQALGPNLADLDNHANQGLTWITTPTSSTPTGNPNYHGPGRGEMRGYTQELQLTKQSVLNS